MRSGRDSVSSYLKTLPMKKQVLTNNDLVDRVNQLQVFTQIQMDENGKDQRPRMPALVSLKVARILDVLERQAKLLNKELKKLASHFVLKNAKGQDIPALSPIGTPGDPTCEHDAAHLEPVRHPGSEFRWRCNRCKMLFNPIPQAGFMLSDGEEYHRQKEAMMEGEVEVETLTLTNAEVAQFPHCPPGSMQALLLFIDHDSPAPGKPKKRDPDDEE